MLNLNLRDIYLPDCFAVDKYGEIVLFAKVRGFPFEYLEEDIGNDLSRIMKNWYPSVKKEIKFAMFVDLANISIFENKGQEFSKKLSFQTSDVFGYYDPEFKHKKIFSLYLTGLTEAWIRDLAYHWKSRTPPKFEEIAKIGLLQLLENGDTVLFNQNMLLNAYSKDR